jgi:uncharacterized Fe-S radical SAM superfamily protein PflX
LVERLWRALRPDSIAVLKDERARRSLTRYFAVMGDELPARFLVCKRVEVKVGLSASGEELWWRYSMDNGRVRPWSEW